MYSSNQQSNSHAQLLGLFINGYWPMCRHMDASCQKGLIAAAPLVFSKWYQTALVTDTILSPANIIGQDFKKAAPFTEYAYVLCPAAKKEDFEQYGFSLLAYSLKTHPLIEDLRVLTDFCQPDRQMDAHLFFRKEDQPLLFERLSQKSDFYLEYLTRLAWWMGLFVYMPAIHIKKVQRAPYCDKFFAQNTETMLRAAAEAACELAAERFSFSMDLEQGIATPAFFLDCLKNNRDTDTIFIDFYKQVDVDIEEIWQTAPADLSEEDQAIVSSFLFTGIMLDKWFLFPLSVFFRLLRPIAFVPIRYYHLVNNLAAMLIMEHNTGAEIFTPPTYYALSPLGRGLFPEAEAEEEKYQIPEGLTYEQILEALERETQLQQLEEMMQMKAAQTIVRIKVHRQSDLELWKIIEVGEQIALDEFCKDLCAAFGVEEITDYTLSVPNENGFPVEYSPPGSKRSVNKTTGHTLGSLGLANGVILILTPAYTKAHALLLEILETTDGDPHILYPRVQSQSAAITDLEKIDEIF